MSNDNETSLLLLIMVMESAVSRVALKKKGKEKSDVQTRDRIDISASPLQNSRTIHEGIY